MKTFAASLLLSIVVCAEIAVSSTPARCAPTVGVKRGDWMEYSVEITGTPPPIHNVTWMRMEVLQVNGDSFPVNLTVRYRNGTLYSSIWQFNFTAGNTEGWLIIPANLGVSNSFYDVFRAKGSNITIQSQAQENVLDATRTVTYANDSLRQKEWDKATGVFVSSYEAFRNWTAKVNMTATNVWTTQAPGLNKTALFGLVAGGLATGFAACSTAVFALRRSKRLDFKGKKCVLEAT